MTSNYQDYHSPIGKSSFSDFQINFGGGSIGSIGPTLGNASLVIRRPSQPAQKLGFRTPKMS